MIPEIIHYCWFGGKEMPAKEKLCIESWKKYFPKYKFIKWNEENFDLNSSTFCKQAYDMKNMLLSVIMYVLKFFMNMVDYILIQIMKY